MNSLINAFRIFADKILLSFQTIQEQQKVIRRLLKKTNSNNSSDSLKHFSLNGNSEEYNDLTGETITFIENFLKNILEKKPCLLGKVSELLSQIRPNYDDKEFASIIIQ